MNISPFAYATTLSGVVHLVLLASWNIADDLAPVESLVPFGTSVEITLVMETLDQGETPHPSTASIESVPVEPTAKAIDPTPREVELQGAITEFEGAMASRNRQNLELKLAVEQLRKYNRLLKNQPLSTREDHTRLSRALNDAMEHNDRLADDNARLASAPDDTTKRQSTLTAVNVRLNETNATLDPRLRLEEAAADSLAIEVNTARHQTAVLTDTIKILESEHKQLQNDLSASSQKTLDLESTISERDTTIQGLALQNRQTMTTDVPVRQRLPNGNERLVDEQAMPAHKLASVHPDVESLLTLTPSTTLGSPNKTLEVADQQSTAVESLAPLRASSASPETGNAERDSSPQPVAGNEKPIYPLSAVKRGIEGKVRLKVSISPSGRVDTVTIEKSSGSVLLDNAALTAVRTWRFHPVVRDGQPVVATDIVPVYFRLNRS